MYLKKTYQINTLRQLNYLGKLVNVELYLKDKVLTKNENLKIFKSNMWKKNVEITHLYWIKGKT